MRCQLGPENLVSQNNLILSASTMQVPFKAHWVFLVGQESKDDQDNDRVGCAQDTQDDSAGEDGGDVESEDGSDDHEDNVGDEEVRQREEEHGDGGNDKEGGHGLAKDGGEMSELVDEDGKDVGTINP